MLDAFSRASSMLDQQFSSFGRLLLSFSKMDSLSGETVEQTKETIKNGKKKWTNDEVQDLFELLEEKPCLWDIFSNEYTKREVKERAYEESVEQFDSSLAVIKAKIKPLRAQTKSGQATPKKYVRK